MSIKAMNCVWEHSKAKGSGLTLLLAIADCANDDGERCFPGIERLARKARISVRHTQRALREIEESGELQVSAGTGPHGCNEYSLRKFIQYHAGRAAKAEGGGMRAETKKSGESVGGDKLSGVTSCRGDAGVAKGVTFEDPKCHPIRKEPSMNRKGEEAAPHSSPPAAPLALASASRRQAAPVPADLARCSEAFREAWGRWKRHLSERDDVRTTRTSELAVLMACERAGDDKAVAVINFSIFKGAKNLIWDKRLDEIPKHLRHTACDSSPARKHEVPGLREWLEARHPHVAGLAWAHDSINVDIRREFAKAHPHLRFSGALLQTFDPVSARHGAAAPGQGRAA